MAECLYFGAVVLVEGGQLFEDEVVGGGEVELLVREGVVAFEVECHGDVVGTGGGVYLSPEEELVCIGEFGESE